MVLPIDYLFLRVVEGESEPGVGTAGRHPVVGRVVLLEEELHLAGGAALIQQGYRELSALQGNCLVLVLESHRDTENSHTSAGVTLEISQ